MPSPPLLVLPHSPYILHPFTVSSGRAQGGPALAAFWARVREATGSSSDAAAAAAFFIAALDAFAARGKACGEGEGRRKPWGASRVDCHAIGVNTTTCRGMCMSFRFQASGGKCREMHCNYSPTSDDLRRRLDEFVKRWINLVF